MTAGRNTTRDFTVAVFVVSQGKVLLHYHESLNRWLPPGGHIEPDELPDLAALRETREETGLTVRLIGDQMNDIAADDQPVQLCRPAGVQLERIRPGHEHIDLIYFAVPSGGDVTGSAAWFGPDSWSKLKLTDEVRIWCERAIASVDRWSSTDTRVRT